MRIVTRNKKKYYKYEKKALTKNIKVAILYFVLSIIVLLIGVLISYLYGGEGPTILGGIGLCSIILNLVSMGYIIYDIYVFKNFQGAIRNMLFFQILYIVMWVFLF